MPAKLYIVPKIPVPLDVNTIPELRKMKHAIRTANRMYDFQASDVVRGREKIDKIFLEGSGRVTNLDLVERPAYIQCLQMDGTRVEKTETWGFNNLDWVYEEVYELMRISNTLEKVGSFFYKALKRIKSYRIAKQISNSLKDGQTGLMEVPLTIFPEAYVQLLAPYIETKYTIPRKEVKENFVDIIEGRKKSGYFRDKIVSIIRGRV